METPDRVDEILEQWRKERPDLDVSGMAVIGRVTRLERAIRPLLSEVFASHELETWEFDVLATLRRSGDPYQLTPGDLLESMMITSGTMTNRVDRLEKRGFVQRSKSKDDRRQVLVSLTKVGRDKVEAALVDHVANESKIIDALDDRQQRQLIELLKVLQGSVAESEHGDHRRSNTPSS